jgi:hypothetical protein
MAGYSSTPLLKKLGIKNDALVYVHHPPDGYFDWISPLPAGVEVTEKLTGSLDFIHVFVTDLKIFQKLFLVSKKHLKKDGMLWISWPKKAAKMETDLDENIIRNFGLQAGLVDVKVCAVNEIWSGLKFVIRVKDR